MPRGGRRANSGRPPGSVTKRTRAIAEGAANLGVAPLDYMLKVVGDPQAAENRRDAMAIASAPFCHPKLNAVATLDAAGKLGAIMSVNIITVPCEMFLSREMADQEYRFKHNLEGSLTITPVWTSPTLAADRDRDLVTVEASSNDDAA